MVLDMVAEGGPTAAGYTTVQGTNSVNSSTGANTFTAGAGNQFYVVKSLTDTTYAARINPLLVPGYTAPNSGAGQQVYHDGKWQATDFSRRTLGANSVRGPSETGSLTPNLIMHLHADDVSTLAATTAIAQWPCRMNNLPVFQASAGARPTYNLKGGKNAVVFAGGQHMSTNDPAVAASVPISPSISGFLTFPQDFTIYTLLWFDSAPAAAMSIVKSDTSALTGAASYKNGGQSVNTGSVALSLLYNGGTVTADTTVATFGTGAWITLVSRYSTAVGVLDTAINGVFDAGTAYSGFTSRYLPINIGSRYFDAGGEYLTGSIREVRIYNTRHSNTQVANVLAVMT